MAITSSIVPEVLQDPKFFAEMEIQHRERLVSMDLCETRFMANLAKGSQIKVTDEILIEATDTNLTDTLTYPQLDSSEQTFTVDNASKVLFQIRDIDDIRSVFNLAEVAKSNAIMAIGRRTDDFNFQQLQARGNLELPSIDLTAISTNAEKGNEVYAAVQDANELIDSGGFLRENRRVVFDPKIMRFLMDADKLQLSTDAAEVRNTNGRVGRLDTTNVNESIRLTGTDKTFATNAKGAIAVGARSFTVDNNGSGTIFIPEIGDTFTNNSVEFVLQTVTEVTKDVEYSVTCDRAIQTAIADNATINITGKETIFVPLVEGRPGDCVIQKNPTFTDIVAEDSFATKFRAFIVHDMFVTLERSRRLVHIPFKVRTIS